MIPLNKLKDIITTNGNLTITFVGSFNQGGCAALYTYNGIFELKDKRLVCPNITYTRHYSEIIMISKGGKLLFGRRCKQCGKAIPKSHGNCFKCYSENIESRF